MPKIIAGMATIPERWKLLGDVVESLIHQVDRLHVASTTDIAAYGIEHSRVKWEKPVGWTDDSRKFLPFLDQTDEDAIYMTVDDDIIYPENYVKVMLEWLHKYDGAAVCVHGSWLSEVPTESYYDRKLGVHFSHEVQSPVQVMFPGTGTFAWRSGDIRLEQDMFRCRNLADVNMGVVLQRQRVPCVAIPRRRAWLRSHPDASLDQSLWGRRDEIGGCGTSLINQFQDSVGWAYPQIHRSA